MPLNFGEGLFQRRDVRETPAGTSTSTSSTSILAPVGSIMAWLKSYTNTPQALPTGWMEADGSAISDADSVYDGQNAPDLNGGEFIRGAATSGGTGGSDTMAHTHTTNVTIDNHAALAMNNHTALTVNAHSNHTALALNTDQHNHNSGTLSTDTASAGAFNKGTSDVISRTAAHSHDVNSGNTGNDTHGHTFSQNIDAHSAHAFGQNISNHAFGQNIDAHTENNPASDAASNTENRPKYYDVVWIFRFK